ncbi:BON domain-containing protein [Streptomyces sp. NPDC057543]|uniref:BON domain-containing protein n=1 Tax=Streptomyces sp. NPDC057543 TaxID=3346163 RepID=UPI0036853D8F
MDHHVIHKQPGPGAAFELQDYERTRAEFNWDEARSRLAGLPGGGLNTGYQAVERQVAAGLAIGRRCAASQQTARGHLKRLPVVDDGRLVGVVSRGDLLKIYLRPDEDIAEELRELITTQLIPAGSATVYVHVSDGIVHLNGAIPDPSLSDVLVRVARTVPGVVNVTARFESEVPA